MPERESLFELIAARCTAAPESTLLEAADGRCWSRAEMLRESGRYARLLAGLGARPGDRVAVQVEKSPQALCLYVACLRAGLVYLPLNTAYRERELDYFFGDAEPRVFVCAPAAEADVAGLARRRGVAGLRTLDGDGGGTLPEQSRELDGEFAPVQRSAGDVAAILYTSGTTGRPKGAMLTHGNLASNALTLVEVWGWQPDDVLLHALPIFHVHGLFVACHCVLLGGGSMRFLPKYEARVVMEQLPGCTVMMGVPTFYTRLLAQPGFGAGQCGRMRLFISGSAPLREATFREFRERTGHTILERYGMSETIMLTSNPLAGPRKPGTVGPPLPGVDLRIVGEDGELLAAGAVGGIEVRGPGVFPGYWRMPEKTAEEFTPDGWFRTGDLGRVDADGYVSIVGRARDMVISGGYNVYPKEVERLIDALDGVVESAVIGVADADLGEAVTAVVVREAERSDVTEAAIIGALKGDIAGYKVPKRVRFVEELPRNAMGKVQKEQLRERFGAAAD